MPGKIQKFAHFIAFFGIFFSVVFVPHLRRICVVLASYLRLVIFLLVSCRFQMFFYWFFRQNLEAN